MSITFSTTKKSREQVKSLIYGRSGTGKTRLIRTAPKPIIISSESKLLSIADDNIPVIEVENVNDLEEAYDFVTSKKGDRFKTICFDSITDIAEKVLSNEKKNFKDQRKAYGEMIDVMVFHIKRFRDIKNKHIYMIAKQRLPKDGEDLICPAMPGTTMTQNLPYLFDEVFALRVLEDDEGKTKTVLQTCIDHEYDCKDSSGKLKAFEAPNLSKIFKKIAKG